MKLRPFIEESARTMKNLAADLKTERSFSVQIRKDHEKTQEKLITCEKVVRDMRTARDADTRTEWEPVIARVIADP